MLAVGDEDADCAGLDREDTEAALGVGFGLLPGCVDGDIRKRGAATRFLDYAGEGAGLRFEGGRRGKKRDEERKRHGRL